MMAAALKEVSPAGAPVQEPGPALGRPDARPDEQPDLLALEQFAQVVEEVERMPLVADRADGSGALGGRHDRCRILGRAGDRFLQVDGQAAVERGDGRRTVGQRRGAHHQGGQVLAVEQLLPVDIDPRSGAVGEGFGSLAVDIAHRDDFGPGERPENAVVLLRDPAGTDDAHGHAIHAASRACARRHDAGQRVNDEYSYQIAPTAWPPPGGPPAAPTVPALWAPAEDDERWRVIRRLADVRFDEEWPWFPSTLLGPCPVPARSALPAAPI